MMFPSTNTQSFLGKNFMNTTNQNDLPADVAEFIVVAEPTKRTADDHIVIDLMQRITGLRPKMWGPT